MPAPTPRAALYSLLSVVVIDLVGFGIVVPVLPFYARSLGASAALLGVLLTSYAAMQMIFAPLWGRLSDRIGRRPVMLATIAGTSAALALLGLADSLPWIFAARILGGVFGANVSVASAYVADATDEAERTRWMGMIGAAFGIGFLLGPAIGGALAPLGYGVPMLVAAALAAANGIHAFFVLREPVRHPAHPEAVATRFAALASPWVRRICTANFVFTFAVTQLETVFAFFMMDRFHYDAREVAWILVAMALVMGTIQGGAMRALAARFGERRLYLSGALLFGVAFAAVPWMGSVPALLVPLAVSAVGRAISQPPLMSLASKVAAVSARGAVMGAFQSSASLARVLGPLAAGALYDRAIAAPFLLASALAFVALALGATLPSEAEALAPERAEAS